MHSMTNSRRKIIVANTGAFARKLLTLNLNSEVFPIMDAYSFVSYALEAFSADGL